MWVSRGVLRTCAETLCDKFRTPQDTTSLSFAGGLASLVAR